MTNAQMLFDWMCATYGKSKTAREWFISSQPNPDDVKRLLAIWEIDLRKYPVEVIQQACQQIKSRGDDFPPSLPVILKHCAAIARERPEHQLLPASHDPSAPMLPAPDRRISRATLRNAVVPGDGDPTRWMGKLFALGPKNLSMCQRTALVNALKKTKRDFVMADLMAGDIPAPWSDRYGEQIAHGFGRIRQATVAEG